MKGSVVILGVLTLAGCGEMAQRHAQVETIPVVAAQDETEAQPQKVGSAAVPPGPQDSGKRMGAGDAAVAQAVPVRSRASRKSPPVRSRDEAKAPAQAEPGTREQWEQLARLAAAWMEPVHQALMANCPQDSNKR